MPLYRRRFRSSAPVSRCRTRVRADLFVCALPVLLALALPSVAFAAGLQTSPWESAVAALQRSFTGPIARGLSLIAVVIGGLMFAFSEGSTKRLLAGIIFGVGMALGAGSFLQWLFPGVATP